MDPVTGIALAASVIQIVTFSIDTVKTLKDVYESGSVSRYDDVGHTTKQLASLTESLQADVQKSSPQKSLLNKEERDLIDLAGKCEDCAQKLQRELRKLQAQPRPSVWAAVRKTFRATRKKGKIDEISKQLESYKSTLETSLLYRLSRRFETQNLRNDQRFSALDESSKRIILCLAESRTSLATLTTTEAEQTRAHIDTQTQQLKQLSDDDRLYDEITKSLFYSDIFSRQEQVDHDFNGIEDSYEWIFDQPPIREARENKQGIDVNTVPRWDDFAKWLKTGQGLYWVNGKAGSGKSTLMNYVCRHPTKLKLLNDWCIDKCLLTPTYFFWNAGTRQQKSIDGLLRSLLYQMLTECRELVGCLKVEPPSGWTQGRLMETMLTLLRQTQIPIATCIFIDGLDEIDVRYDRVIVLVQELMAEENVKLCVSSRPELAFEKSFSTMPGLRLQDLTFDSIRSYAYAQLSHVIQEGVLDDRSAGRRVEGLLRTIVKRANGVFLWVVIVIKDVRDGIEDIADLDELTQAIDELPSQLEDLFMHMLERIKSSHQRDPARFLQIALYMPLCASDWDDWGSVELTLTSLYFIQSQQGLIEDAPFTYYRMTTSEVIQACEILRNQVLSHTAGLLEVAQTSHPEDEDLCIHGLSPEDESISVRGSKATKELVFSTKIAFLHRTVRDFLLLNENAHAFLARKGFVDWQAHLAIARGILAQVAQFPEEILDRLDDPDSPPRLFSAFMQHISLAERLTGLAQSRLIWSVELELFRDSMVRHALCHSELRIAAPFQIHEDYSLIDIVGIAAATGMTRFVCEQLNISYVSQDSLANPPNKNEYSSLRASTRPTSPARLSWTIQSEKSDKNRQSRWRQSDYRQNLASSLQLELTAEIRSPKRTEWFDNAFAETYLLSCCTPSSQDLVQILLHAGANPMVVVNGGSLTVTPCFWEKWLGFLRDMRQNYMISIGRSGGILLDSDYISLNFTPRTVFETTKALLVNGADINFPIRAGRTRGEIRPPLKRCLPNDVFEIRVDCTAMFMLEECFGKEPEFRTFATDIEPLIKKPTRTLVKIATSMYSKRYPGGRMAPVRSEDELERLWPLVEKWEQNGHRNDFEALQSAMLEIVKAHNPDKSTERKAQNSPSSWGTDEEI